MASPVHTPIPDLGISEGCTLWPSGLCQRFKAHVPFNTIAIHAIEGNWWEAEEASHDSRNFGLPPKISEEPLKCQEIESSACDWTRGTYMVIWCDSPMYKSQEIEA